MNPFGRLVEEKIPRDLETTRRSLRTPVELIQSGNLLPKAETEARLRFEEKIKRFNRRIFLYNLQAPTTLVHRPLIQLQQELSQLPRRIQPTKS